jgi:hypothetical protein
MVTKNPFCMLMRLTGTVPNRPDIALSLGKAIDADGLLLQMLSRRDVATADDLLNSTLTPVIEVLKSLQAADKADVTGLWWKAFTDNCLSSASVAGGDFNAVIYNIPAFFEFVTASLDELRRDIANFYISQVSADIRSSGPAYLGVRLFSRLRSEALKRRDPQHRAAELKVDEIYPNTFAFLRSVLRRDAPMGSGATSSPVGILPVIQELNEHAGTGVFYREEDIGRSHETDKGIVAQAIVLLLQVCIAMLPNVTLWNYYFGRYRFAWIHLQRVPVFQKHWN